MKTQASFPASAHLSSLDLGQRTTRAFLVSFINEIVRCANMSCQVSCLLIPGFIPISSLSSMSSLLRLRPQAVLNVASGLLKEMSPFLRQMDYALDWELIEAGRAVYRWAWGYIHVFPCCLVWYCTFFSDMMWSLHLLSSRQACSQAACMFSK